MRDGVVDVRGQVIVLTANCGTICKAGNEMYTTQKVLCLSPLFYMIFMDSIIKTM